MAASWLPDERGSLLVLLWVSGSVMWAIVALCWAYHYFAKREPGWPLLLTTAAIPASVGLPMLFVFSGGHPGAYMLLASSALALWSGRKVADQ